MANKECTACIHKAVCKTAESCDGYVPGCKHFKEGWISAKDRLPEDDADVLAYQNRKEESRIVPANYGGGIWFDCSFDCEADNITHWMPLPQPPKGE